MPYTKMKKQPARRKHPMPDALARGLYEDETAVTLDDGTLVAVSVERHWQENGSGIAFHAYARHIQADGQTNTAPNGAHVEAAVTFNADPVTLSQFGEDAIATELARLTLGEEHQLFRDVPQEDGSTKQEPVVAISDVAKLNCNIRHQVRAVQATRSSAINL